MNLENTPATQTQKLTNQEKLIILNKFNEPPSEYPRNEPLHKVFEKCVEEFPQQIAVEFMGQTLTYKQLNEKANQLAHHLKSIGINKEQSVGVFVERNIEMIISFVAILKIGAAYLPLDPVYPIERLEFMIKDTSTPVILTHEKLKAHISATKTVLLNSDFSSYPTTNLEEDVSPTAIAYIMYTSGSTGNPKGIGVVHRGIMRLVKNPNYMKVSPQHTFAQISNSCFDAATFEIWGALLNGARLLIIPTDNVLLAPKLRQILREKKVDVSFITTALFNQLVSHLADTFSSLEYVLVGGEACNPLWMKEALKIPPKNLINIYGPTENTSFTTAYLIKEVIDGESIPIGKPVSNTQAFILDKNLDVTPIGEIGELYLAGDGLARGYINRPEINEKSFIQNPFGEGKLYKTGDLVRYKDSGDLEFIGRVDHQVKIRGFRIELGEIENQLFNMPQISKAVILVKEYTPGDKKLVAYIENKPQQIITGDDIKKYLQDHLPHYMIPSHFVIMDIFPLNENGKVDRKALPEIIDTNKNKNCYMAFSNEMEAQVMEVWQNLLTLPEIQLDDNFFELGGNSLLATQLLFEINKKLSCNISLEDIYQNSTLSQLSTAIKKNSNSPTDQYTVLIKSGNKTPLFVFPDLAGDTASYSQIIKYLEPDQAVYGFRPPGIFDDKKPLKSIKKMANFYIGLIKKIQPTGPYMLAGLSMAGTIAYEIAQQFIKQNEKVALLVLLDTDSGLSFSKETFKSSLTMLRSIWHNILYLIFRPVKLKGVLLREVVNAVKLIWKVELSAQDLLNCKTEEEQYIHLLQKLKDAKRFSPYVTLQQFKKIMDLTGANYLATLSYFPSKYPHKIHFFKPEQKSEVFTIIDYKKWQRLAKGKIEFHVLPGNHFNFFLEPSAQKIGQKLQEYINNA